MAVEVFRVILLAKVVLARVVVNLWALAALVAAMVSIILAEAGWGQGGQFLSPVVG